MNKIILYGIATVITGVILAATTWNFASVADMPKRYVTKEDNSKEHVRIENKLDKIYDHLIRKDK